MGYGFEIEAAWRKRRRKPTRVGRLWHHLVIKDAFAAQYQAGHSSL
jgi:hypothetical protein